MTGIGEITSLQSHFCSVSVMNTKLDVHLNECSVYKEGQKHRVPEFNLASIIHLDKFE